MFIQGLNDADAMPALERMMQFAARRQEIIQHNIANISTPNYQPLDVSVEGFQQQLAEAVEQRRDQFGGQRGELILRTTREVSAASNGGLDLTPSAKGRNLLFHDRNNRDLERLMQDLVENTAMFRVASDLLRSRMQLMRSAISERV